MTTQVGELEARSSQAAKETGTLIMSTVEAIEEGKQISEQFSMTMAEEAENLLRMIEP